MSIEAKLHAPTASFVERVLVYGTAGVLFALGLVAANTFPFAPKLLGAGLAVWLASPLLLRRPRGTRAHVECEGGRIRIRPDRMPPRTIETRKLVGASVARNGEGVVVTLSERGSRIPIEIELKTANDANEVRSALGIPHGGFGEIAWTVAPKPIDLSLLFTRAVALILLTGEFFASFASASAAAAFLVPAIVASILAALLAFTSFMIRGRAIAMRSSGVLAVVGEDPVYLPFKEIAEIDDDGRTMTFRPRKEILESLEVPCAPTRWSPSGLRADERALMITQLRGALAASKGEIAPFVDPTTHLDALKRNDASLTDWLARLDALAHLQDNTAYRSTSIAKDDLWRALESHDAPTDVRAGAARVLLRVSTEKEHDRIARAIDSIHRDDERTFVRAALRDDAEEAAAEIEEASARLLR